MLRFVVVSSALVCVANARPQTFDTSKGEKPFTFDVSKDPYAYAFDVSKDPYAYTFDVQKDPYAYTFDVSKDPYAYTFDANKDPYKYTYDHSKNPYLYDPAKDQFAGQNGGAAGSASIGELLDTLNVLTKSTLFTELLNLGDNDCQILQDPEVISEANAVVQARRGELEAAFR